MLSQIKTQDYFVHTRPHHDRFICRGFGIWAFLGSFKWITGIIHIAKQNIVAAVCASKVNYLHFTS